MWWAAAPATVKTKRIELLWIASRLDPDASQGVGSPIDHGRILANLQLASHPVSPGLLVVIVAGAIILFFGMGLLAHVGFAIFLKSNGDPPALPGWQ
jgi:hypothetical protein